MTLGMGMNVDISMIVYTIQSLNMLHTLAANSMAGMWQITVAPSTHIEPKKQKIKEVVDRQSEPSPFSCKAFCRVERKYDCIQYA